MHITEATLEEEINVPATPSNINGPGTRASVGRWLLLVTCLFIVLVSSCLLSLFAPKVQRYLVKSWLEDLDRRCGIALVTKDFVWNWPFTVTLHAVEMDLHGKRLMDCVEAAVTFSLSGARPFWYVKELVLDHPVFYLEKDSTGRWATPSPSPRGSKAGGGSQGEPPARESPRSIRIRLDGGTIVAEQDGQSVMRVGNISGQLTLSYDDGGGMRSLLASVERLRPGAPRPLNLHGDDAGQSKSSGF